ncbi:MAG: KamA family radical SAM protein [Candidatus Omnitrophica bacterium]|nr:KamA family radical SAM protein [Candidatus Omnitrophota bacterium]
MSSLKGLNNKSQEQESPEETAINLTRKESRFISLYEEATALDWEDWRWQLKNRITTEEQLSKIINLTDEEKAGIDGCGKKLKMAITPYFASLMDPKNPNCPIRMQCVPRGAELITSEEEMTDPCGEDKDSPVEGLVHRYPDRVLFLVSEVCATYCRHCTRSRIFTEGRKKLGYKSYEKAFDYIRSNKSIRDVLISGGDPLLLSNEALEHILKTLKEIPHVEFIRIGTRVPVTLPQRINHDLVKILKKYSPVWMSLHFNHAKEITKRVKFACDMLVDSGIPLGSQTVLLKGINDSSSTMKRLMHELLKIRVRPYYIYQCDPIVGSKHFRTKVSTGINIMENLRGHTTGYGVPTYVIDGPGGGGKIPISPNYIVSYEKGKCVIRNYKDEQFTYTDPA